MEEPAAPPPQQAQPQPQPQPQAQRLHRQPDSSSSKLAELQNSITRIYEACKAPPLPPSEYQLLFTLIATEVHERGFSPQKTSQAIVARANQEGLRIAMKDVAFVLDAVDEIDPWLEHTRSPAAVARAYRDFVLAKCHHAGVILTEDEHQLVQVWFGASQWAPAGAGAGLGAMPALAAEGAARMQSGRERGYIVESALPPPSARGEIPLPPEYEYDSDLEIQQIKSRRGSASASSINMFLSAVPDNAAGIIRDRNRRWHLQRSRIAASGFQDAAPGSLILLLPPGRTSREGDLRPASLQVRTRP